MAVPLTGAGCTLSAVYVAGPTDHLYGKRFEENLPGMVLGTADNIKRTI